MRTFGRFLHNTENKIANLIISTNPAIIQESLQEVFDKYISESGDKESLLTLYNNAISFLVPTSGQTLFLETETATAPSIKYSDPTDIGNYVGKLADSVISHAKKTLGTDKISSHFLSELLNAIMKRSGRNIVDPERGGQSFRFASTHSKHPDEVETLKKKWEDIPDRYKAHYLLNLAKYYYKYTGDVDQAFEKVKKSIDPTSLTNNTQKGNFTRALTQARQWWDGQSRNVPMNPYKEPAKQEPVTAEQPDDKEFQSIVRHGASMLEKGMDYEQMRTAVEAKYNINKISRPQGGRARLWAAIKQEINEKYPQLGGKLKNMPKSAPAGKLQQDPHIDARMSDLVVKLGQKIKDRATAGQYKFAIPLTSIIGDIEPNSVSDPKILKQYADAFKQHLEDEFGGEYAWGMYPTVDSRSPGGPKLTFELSAKK